MQFIIERASHEQPPHPKAVSVSTVEDGHHITRWYIEIASLEELLALVNEVGEVIVEPTSRTEGYSLVIYDSFVE